MTEKNNEKKDWRGQVSVSLPVSILDKSARYGINRSGLLHRELIKEIAKYEREHPEVVSECPQ